MDLSFFLAQLFGLTLIIFALAAMFRPAIINEVIKELRPNSFAALMAGFFGIVAGLAIILNHNIWEISWVGVVTLFGWAALIKGITYVAFPHMIINTAHTILAGKSKKVATAIVFFVGCYLTYNGFAY